MLELEGKAQPKTAYHVGSFPLVGESLMFEAREGGVLTLLHTDGHYGAAELQTLIPVRVHCPGSTLDSGASLEVD